MQGAEFSSPARCLLENRNAPLCCDSVVRGHTAFADALPRLFLKIYYSVAT